MQQAEGRAGATDGELDQALARAIRQLIAEASAAGDGPAAPEPAAAQVTPAA